MGGGSRPVLVQIAADAAKEAALTDGVTAAEAAKAAAAAVKAAGGTKTDIAKAEELAREETEKELQAIEDAERESREAALKLEAAEARKAEDDVRRKLDLEEELRKDILAGGSDS